MRCCQCDANDQGLSLFNDQKAFAFKFHIVHGDVLCDECYQQEMELEADYYYDDMSDEEFLDDEFSEE